MDPNAEYQARLNGIERLYGRAGVARLRQAHVCVIGVGGVGSWTVEALARTGLGQLTLVDLDDVCISNTSRQLPALTGSFGQPKVEVLAERVTRIHPSCRVHPLRQFFTAATMEQILQIPFCFVVDAIDSAAHKTLLLAACRDRNIPVLTSGSAGGRRDPTQIRVADLAQATHDRLLQEVRKRLRQQHGFPRRPGQKFKIECVYSPEPVVYPHQDGSVCATREPGSDLRLDCHSGYGSATFVTGAVGFALAARVVTRLAAAPGK